LSKILSVTCKSSIDCSLSLGQLPTFLPMRHFKNRIIWRLSTHFPAWIEGQNVIVSQLALKRIFEARMS
jgi:hypothetical protein